jgi:hypothetical protein
MVLINAFKEICRLEFSAQLATLKQCSYEQPQPEENLCSLNTVS